MSAWDIKSLGDVCAVNPRLTGDEIPSPETEVSFVPMAAVDETFGEIVDRQIRTYQDVAKGYTSFRNGDVLFAKITPCMENGKTAIASNLVNALGFGSTEFHVLRPGNEVLSEWVHYFIRLPSFRNRAEANFTGSAGQRRVPTDFMKRVPIPVPPLDEQERIVKLLDEADALRKLRAEADRRTGELVPALFYEMFGDPVENPMGWQKAALGDIANLYSGATPTRSEIGNWNGTIPWISPKDMKSEELGQSEESITEEAIKNTRLRLLPSQTVLMVVRGMILAHTIPICLTKVPSTINQDVKALMPTREINSVYLQWALKAQHRNLLGQIATAGHGTKKLDSDRLRAVPVPLPPIESQRVFASLVEKVRNLRLAQEFSGEVSGQLIPTLQFSYCQ